MAHIHDLIDFTVAIFVVAKGKVLLIHHKQLKKWLPLGGHIELTEDPERAAIREAYEESGLRIKLIGERPRLRSKGTRFLTTPRFLDIHRISKQHEHIGLIYFAKPVRGKLKLSESEHHDIRWFSIGDLAKAEYRIIPAVKFYAKTALREV